MQIVSSTWPQGCLHMAKINLNTLDSSWRVLSAPKNYMKVPPLSVFLDKPADPTTLRRPNDTAFSEAQVSTARNKDKRVKATVDLRASFSKGYNQMDMGQNLLATDVGEDYCTVFLKHVFQGQPKIFRFSKCPTKLQPTSPEPQHQTWGQKPRHLWELNGSTINEALWGSRRPHNAGGSSDGDTWVAFLSWCSSESPSLRLRKTTKS